MFFCNFSKTWTREFLRNVQIALVLGTRAKNLRFKTSDNRDLAKRPLYLFNH